MTARTPIATVDDLAVFLQRIEALFHGGLRERAGGAEDLRRLGYGSIRVEFKLHAGRFTLVEFQIGSTDTPEGKR